MPPKTTVKPVRVHVPDADRYCDTIRGVGFRAAASDGWRGPHRRSYAAARADARAYAADLQAVLADEAVSATEGKAV